MVLSIVRYPDPFLRKPTIEVDRTQESIVAQAEGVLTDMEDTLTSFDHGAALSANQVGSSFRMFVTNQNMTYNSQDENIRSIPPYVINPRITFMSDEKSTQEEGCLSFPKIYFQVTRPKSIKVNFYDNLWKFNEMEFDGFWARVFLHEIDHLDGKLFVDFLNRKKKQDVLDKMLGKRR